MPQPTKNNVANSDRDRKQLILAREFQDTVTAHSNNIKKVGDKPYEKTDSIPEVKVAELAKKQREASEKASRPRASDDKKSTGDVEKILSKELKKVGAKKLTDRQRANKIKKLNKKS